ncbi:aldose 1-epimerase family protein, partial [Singulisphaera rosea]
MATYPLTDLTHDVWIDSFDLSAFDFDMPPEPDWTVIKRTLRGGRRQGVDLIHVNNGALSFTIVPTRGMGIWKAWYQGDPIGWDSPVKDGPVHPHFVNLMNSGGLGWLEGFDGLLARCGLENNGAPYGTKSVDPDGSERHTLHGLHGKIDYLPASFVAVHIAHDPPYEITIEGHVEEARLFGPQIRLVTKITTTPGSNTVKIHDEFVNLKDSPGEMQILYHWNFGSPYLNEGSRFVAPIKVVAPRDARAQEGIDHFEHYARPEPGFAEQAYFAELHAGKDDRTLAMLRNQAGDKGVVLRYAKSQLPAFTLWKNTGGRKEGYVTGLEPATNYPNPKPFEASKGRVVALAPEGRYLTETTLEVVSSVSAVAG